jgi:hypothetical protein
MKALVRRGLALVVLIVVLGGCVGAGPAGRGTGSSRARCSQGGPDDQRALVYIFCVESP